MSAPSRPGALRRAAIALACAATAAGAVAQPSTPPPGSGDFVVAPTDPANPPLAVFYHVPRGARGDAPVVVALHGALRQGEKVRDAWAPQAEAFGLIVVVPQFDAVGYRGDANYNLGRVPVRGAPAASSQWSFQVVEQVFEAARSRLGLSAQGYTLYGHSAGAQFAHRFAQLMPAPRAVRYLVANAGWYTFVDPALPYPWGLGGTGVDDDAQCRNFSRPLIVMLGERDDDPGHRQLSRAAGAMRQGRHRLERGENFFSAARARAAALGCAFDWSLRIVPGVGHESARMAGAAAALLAAER